MQGANCYNLWLGKARLSQIVAWKRQIVPNCHSEAPNCYNLSPVSAKLLQFVLWKGQIVTTCCLKKMNGNTCGVCFLFHDQKHYNKLRQIVVCWVFLGFLVAPVFVDPVIVSTKCSFSRCNHRILKPGCDSRRHPVTFTDTITTLLSRAIARKRLSQLWGIIS